MNCDDTENDSGIILCGVCKNTAGTVPVIRAAFEELASKAGVPCWAVFYENNSDDGTAAELMKWAAEAPGQVIVRCEKFTREEELSRCVARTCDNRPCRIEQIAFARNRLLDMLEGELPGNQGSPHPSYRGATPTGTTAPLSGDVPAPTEQTCPVGGVGGAMLGTVGSLVMIDTDNPVPFPVDSVLRCIARDPDGFDALVCNGLNSSGQIYDTYAYRDAQFPFGPEIMRDAFWSGHHQYYMRTAVHNQTLFFNRQLRENPARLPYVPILSGFNGLCIFRREALMGLRYSAVPTAEMNAEYEALYSIPPFSNTIVNGASVGIHLFPNDKGNDTHKDDNDKGIFYFHNSGYNFPVVCEHTSLFAAMRARNHRRIYLCTDLVWNWI